MEKIMLELPELVLMRRAFGNKEMIEKRGPDGVKLRRLGRCAEVEVDRTPMFTVVGEPQPVHEDDLREALYADDDGDEVDSDKSQIIDHDPLKYDPYTDLVFAGGRFFLVEMR